MEIVSELFVVRMSLSQILNSPRSSLFRLLLKNSSEFYFSFFTSMWKLVDLMHNILFCILHGCHIVRKIRKNKKN